MANLTKKMREILLKADFEHRRINDVPLATMHGLEQRGLISDSWRRRGPQSTEAGRFPHYFSVPLTEAGLRAASALARPGSAT